MLGMVWIREGGVVNNGKKLAPKLIRRIILKRCADTPFYVLLFYNGIEASILIHFIKK